MDVRSLAFRTDLAILQLGGSEVTDHGTHLVVRTEANPQYFWGNFLLLATPPTPELTGHWMETFRRAFPEARHRAFGVDGTDGSVEDLAPFAALGFDTDGSTVMTARSVREPPRPQREATYRPLRSDADWAQQLDLALVGEDEHTTRDFATRRALAQRRLTEAGHGEWFGAFLGERLASSMGLVRAGEGLARFQEVKTHPEARGRGLAGTLVHRVSEFGFQELGADTLVMVADPDYLAVRVYRSVGFAHTETQLETMLAPGPESP